MCKKHSQCVGEERKATLSFCWGGFTLTDGINLQETLANPLAHLFHSTAHLLSSHIAALSLEDQETAYNPGENPQDEAVAWDPVLRKVLKKSFLTSAADRVMLEGTDIDSSAVNPRCRCQALNINEESHRKVGSQNSLAFLETPEEPTCL